MIASGFLRPLFGTASAFTEAVPKETRTKGEENHLFGVAAKARAIIYRCAYKQVVLLSTKAPSIPNCLNRVLFFVPFVLLW